MRWPDGRIFEARLALRAGHSELSAFQHSTLFQGDFSRGKKAGATSGRLPWAAVACDVLCRLQEGEGTLTWPAEDSDAASQPPLHCVAVSMSLSESASA